MSDPLFTGLGGGLLQPKPGVDPNPFVGVSQRDKELQGFGETAQQGSPALDYGQAQEAYGNYRNHLGQQQENADYLHSVAMGEGPSVAARQQQAGTDAAIRAQMHAAHGSLGAGAAMAARAAELQGAAAMGHNVQQAGHARAAELAAAQNQYGQQLGVMSDQALEARGQGAQIGQYAASLEMQRRAENNRMRNAFEGMRNQAGIAQLGARSGQLQLVTSLAQQQRLFDQSRADARLAGGLSAGGSALSYGAKAFGGGGGSGGVGDIGQTFGGDRADGVGERASAQDYTPADGQGEVASAYDEVTSDERQKENVEKLDAAASRIEKDGGNVFLPRRVNGERTHLEPDGERRFGAWGKQHGIRDIDHPDAHYDYRGAFAAGVNPSDGHWPDTFKQHGHPTFSEESQYSRGAGDGGTWDGEDFRPSATHAVADQHGFDRAYGVRRSADEMLRRKLADIDTPSDAAPSATSGMYVRSDARAKQNAYNLGHAHGSQGYTPQQLDAFRAAGWKDPAQQPVADDGWQGTITNSERAPMQTDPGQLGGGTVNAPGAQGNVVPPDERRMGGGPGSGMLSDVREKKKAEAIGFARGTVAAQTPTFFADASNAERQAAARVNPAAYAEPGSLLHPAMRSEHAGDLEGLARGDRPIPMVEPQRFGERTTGVLANSQPTSVQHGAPTAEERASWPRPAPTSPTVNGRAVSSGTEYGPPSAAERRSWAQPRGGSEVSAFLDPLEPYSFDYKNPARDGAGRHYGIMAQDLERSPMGASMVVETPHGKVVDTRKATMGSLAALADMNKRLRAVEGR